MLFNENWKTENTRVFKFQNILCCCLTQFCGFGMPLEQKFQNILCCCLTRTVHFQRLLPLKISKHPMLLFNANAKGIQHIAYDRFQNILCCCLTLWLRQRGFCKKLFQNILCCCLTVLQKGQRDSSTPFQNILCCCLTPSAMVSVSAKSNFKTSYVVV